MNNDGSKLREVMARHLDELQPATPIEQIRRRARRGRLVMRISLAALAVFVTASATFVLARLSDGSSHHAVGPGPAAEDGLIAFTTQDNNDPQPWIAVVPAPGGEITRLREGRDPSWSPDGTRIAFACDRGICTMNADGSAVHQLTNPEAPGFDEAPDWGPQGRIAFTRNYMDHPRLESARPRDIVLVGDDGGEQITITNHQSDDSEPTWSPDGKSIAYIRAQGRPSEAPPGGWQLWTMNADGTGSIQLTGAGAGRPDWSPDGRSILFDEASALWTIPSEVGEPDKLPVVSGSGFDVGSSPSWAPEARRFAFTCSSKGTDDNDICLSEVGSDEWTALVATRENEASPAWQPTAPIEGSDGETFGRYKFTIGGGFSRNGEPIENTGLVEVDASEGSVCVESNVKGATSAHLLREGAEAWDHIVIFEIPRDYRPSMCSRGLDGPSLQAVIDDPTMYLIEFSNKFTGKTLTAPLEIIDGASVDDGNRQNESTGQQGRVSCDDTDGDLMSEGSGDRSGRGAQAPEQPQAGADLAGFSMSRYDGTLEMNWGTHGQVPDFLADGAKLTFVLTGSSKEPGYTFASITATLRNDRWKVLIRNTDDEADYLQTPEVAGNMVNLVIEPGLVPRLMRGTFRWRAISKWEPAGGPVYNDYCPDSGFPRFEGTSS